MTGLNDVCARTVLLTLAALLWAGCGGDGADEAAARQGGEGVEQALETMREAGVVPDIPDDAADAGRRYAANLVPRDCDRLVPDALRAKHGLTDLETILVVGQPTARCDLKLNDQDVSISFACVNWSERVFRRTMENGRDAINGRDVPGIGRMAYVGAMTLPGLDLTLPMVGFWDDDTPCYAQLNAPDEEAALSLARDLVDTLNPESLDPAG